MKKAELDKILADIRKTLAPENNVDYIAMRIQFSKSAEEVDAEFEKLKPLDASIRLRIVDKVEERIINDAEAMVAIENLAEDGLGSRDPEDFAERINFAEVTSQIFFHISQIKGEAAQPFTRIFVQEAAKLSDQDYNSVSKLFNAAVKAYNGEESPPDFRTKKFHPNPHR